MENISNIQRSKIAQWYFIFNLRSLANKTSLSYISCYASKINTHVYLQRGFRQYGIPQVNAILLSNNWYLECIKYSTESTTQPTYRDCANASVSLAFKDLLIQSEIVSMNANINTRITFSNTEWIKTIIINVNAVVVFAPRGLL